MDLKRISLDYSATTIFTWCMDTLEILGIIGAQQLLHHECHSIVTKEVDHDNH